MEEISKYNAQDHYIKLNANNDRILNENLLQFIHSFGYDSSRQYNICAADNNTIVYLSGNYIHVYNIPTQVFKFVRSLSGIGFGHVAKHPSKAILAVGERGENPFIVIYSMPEFSILKLLKGETEKFYNYMSFSPNGERLITQGGEPDHLLTIWDWELEKMILKGKVGRETWKVETNPFVPGEFITSGGNHITFWLTADTFTGLKLKRYPGKFGSHAFCSISTFCALPNGQLLTPNEINNLYVWRGEEIIVEIRRSGGLPLHEEKIVHVEYRENSNEIVTVGMEGTYKMWDYSRVCDVSKRNDFIALQPTYQRTFEDEFGIAKPLAFQRKFSRNSSTSYFMQDKEGSIWDVEMSVDANIKPFRRILMGHGLPVGDIAPSPVNHYLATVGGEGKLHVYCIQTKRIILFKKFCVGASSLLWLPVTVSSTGLVLIVGFLDGSVRTVVLSLSAQDLQAGQSTNNCLNVVQAFKPHSKTVSAVSLNPHQLEKPMVLTCSLDKKIFIHWLKPLDRFLKLETFAFVEMPGGVCCITWNPILEMFLVSTDNGIIVEVTIPEELPKPPSTSYKIILSTRTSQFTSVKSKVIRKNVIIRNFQRKQRHQGHLELKEKQQKLKGKKEELGKLGKFMKGHNKSKKILKELTEKWEIEREKLKPKLHKEMSSTEVEKYYELCVEKSISLMTNLPLSVFLRDTNLETEEPLQKLFKSDSFVSLFSSGEESEENMTEGEYSEDEAVPPHYVPPHQSPLFFTKYIDRDSFWLSAGSYDNGYVYQYNIGENIPCRTVPNPLGDVDLTCCLELSKGEYLIFGTGNGGIQLVKKNYSDGLDFSNYYLSIVHDNCNGKVKKICNSYDERYIFTLGEDANIFVFELNMLEKDTTQMSTLPEAVSLPISLKIDDDIISSDTLSLEESLMREKEEKRKKMGEERRAGVREQLENISRRFLFILDLNGSLPLSQRFPEEFFIIDPKFEDENTRSFIEKKKRKTFVSENIYFNEKNKRNKMFNHFIRPVKTFKIYLFGIGQDTIVTTFFQPKVTLNFLQAEKEVEASITEILNRGSEKELRPLKIPKGEVPHRQFKRRRLEVRPLFIGEEIILESLEREDKLLFTRLSQRRERRHLLDNLIKLFLEEKDWKIKQFSKDIELRKEKQEDMRYILKSDQNYNLNNLKKITTERKLYQLITTKRKIYNLMTNFNNKVLKLREKKSKILALFEAALKDINAVISEFTDVTFPQPPKKISLIEPLEFPELYYMDYPPNFPHKQENMDSYRRQMYSQLYEINQSFPIDSEISHSEQIAKFEKLKEVMPVEAIEKAALNKLWEEELLEERKQFLLAEYFKKGQIIQSMISEFNEELDKLLPLRMDYEVKIQYLKLFCQKYYEELQIVRSHQLLENKIIGKLKVFLLQKHIYILRINIKNKKINNCFNEINKANVRIDRISKAFSSLISKLSSKLKRHLTNLFKKKWKPERIRHEDDESSSSEEEEEDEDEEEEDEEEEEGDLYIEDLLAMDHHTVDERTKPPGLDDFTFDETFNLRELRQAEEKRIFELKGQIQDLNDQKDGLWKTSLTIETIIAFYQVKLSYVLENKHKELSSVRTVVILDASQMQHFNKESNEFPAVRDTLLFPLFSLKNLETRKRKFKEDLLKVHMKKHETVKHVKRLDLDIKYLKNSHKNLIDQISQEKLEKFGVPVNIEKLEEAILLIIVKELKYNTLPFHMKFHCDLVKLQKEFERIELSTTDHIKKNTYEELKYGALLEQKQMYEKCKEKLKFPNLKEYVSLEELNRSIHELLAVLKMQEDRIECLEDEINRLRYISYIPDSRKVKKLVKLKEIKDELYEDEIPNCFDEEVDEEESLDKNIENELESLSQTTASDQAEDVLQKGEGYEECKNILEEDEYLIANADLRIEEFEREEIVWEKKKEEFRGEEEMEDEAEAFQHDEDLDEEQCTVRKEVSDEETKDFSEEEIDKEVGNEDIFREDHEDVMKEEYESTTKAEEQLEPDEPLGIYERREERSEDEDFLDEEED